MNGYKHRFRTLSATGRVGLHETRELADQHAAGVAARSGSACLFAHAPRFNPVLQTSGQDHTGTVRNLFRCKVLNVETYLIVFDDSQQVEATVVAACYRT